MAEKQEPPFPLDLMNVPDHGISSILIERSGKAEVGVQPVFTVRVTCLCGTGEATADPAKPGDLMRADLNDVVDLAIGTWFTHLMEVTTP